LSASAPLRVGRVTVDVRSVFDPSEARHGSFYRAVNRLHVQTRAELIRSFLLFREGEPYDPVKLAETERNLRQFDFLERVSVTAAPPHDGVVDITVVTTDAWTTAVTGDFSNEGGISVYDVDVSQKDLFGTGAALELLVDRGTERTAKAAELRHPAIFGPYWNLDALGSKNSDGDEEKIAVDRVRDSYVTPATADFLADRLARDERIYREGQIAALFQQRHRALVVSRSWTLQARPDATSSVFAGVDLLDDEFSPPPERPNDVLPDRRHFRFLDGGYERAGFVPVKLDYVDRDSREQDFNLGHLLSLHAAVGPKSWRLQAEAGDGLRFAERSFLVGRIHAMFRAAGTRLAVVSADVRTVTRFGAVHPQAFVTRARIDVGRHLDRDMQFFADGQNGLRAYPDFAFEGDRRMIVNVEHRAYLGREILQLFSPSVAVFVDSGQAGNGAFHGMKSDAGVGLRIGIARYDAALIRIDYAYALNASPLNRRGKVVSISTSHAF
jgi:hypothetical protein